MFPLLETRVNGARYRSPEGSLAPEQMGRTVRTAVFMDLIGQLIRRGRRRRTFANFFLHKPRLETRFARKNSFYLLIHLNTSLIGNHGCCCLKKSLNTSRSSEHPPVRGEDVKTFRWDHWLQKQKLFMAFMSSSHLKNVLTSFQFLLFLTRGNEPNFSGQANPE